MAAALGRGDEAARCFEHALASHARMGARPWLATTQVAYAELLLASGGSTELSRGLAAEAWQSALTLGMSELAARAEPLQASTPRRAPARPDQPVQTFRREGELWTIVYSGKQIRLRDMRGMRYLARLLREPGREVHACELVALEGRPPPPPEACDGALPVRLGLSDPSVPLDARARREYRERLAELEAEEADAARGCDLGRLERARKEREFLIAELGAASRRRRASSDAERARVAVTKAIKSALDKIAAEHAELGLHLAATIRRGYYCAYLPDPRHPIAWNA
jgi:hypothetical protein